MEFRAATQLVGFGWTLIELTALLVSAAPADHSTNVESLDHSINFAVADPQLQYLPNALWPKSIGEPGWSGYAQQACQSGL